MGSVGNSGNISSKQEQLDIINATNPAPNDNLTWIRSTDDIKSFRQVWEEEPEIDPDFTQEDYEEAIRTGYITVYSSYDINNGTFVSPSRMEAESYGGSNNVKSKRVKLEDVAWIDSTQGMYAKRRR